MPRSTPVLAIVLALIGVLLVSAPASAADRPTEKALYETGPSGRYLLDGDWLFRLDKSDRGERLHFERQTSSSGWRTIAVPYSWNATDYSDASHIGTVAWYRKDFELPTASAAYKWVTRFEAVNYHARVWLNGKEIGRNRGSYLPFELRLRGDALRRTGVNRLVVRVDNRRTTEDLPPAGFARKTNQPTGGWWNYGGLTREVYLRRISHVDLSTVQVLPELPCRTCDATVLVRAVVRNLDAKAQTVHLTGKYGAHAVDLGTLVVGPASSKTFAKRIQVPSPQLWSPGSPHLYRVDLTAEVNGRTAQTWTTQSGIRSIKNVNGKLFLNGNPLNWRGFGMHEDHLEKGFALDNADRDQIVATVQDLGATLMRSHYPLHPYLMEKADREGLLVWSEIPMYQVRVPALNKERVRRFGVRMMAENVLANGNHPSVIVWSVGNELNTKVNRQQGEYIADAARVSRRLDPTRPVGIAIAGYAKLPCQKRYSPLDIIGINEYYNWYPGPDGSMADPGLLSGYLDKMRRCHPTEAIAVTEFGAEANRDGPVEERGTYQFQEAFIREQLDVLDRKPFLSGATYWALQEFRVRPQWDGGNPRPFPPFHQKGVITLTGFKKPGYFALQERFKAVEQFPTG